MFFSVQFPAPTGRPFRLGNLTAGAFGLPPWEFFRGVEEGAYKADAGSGRLGCPVLPYEGVCTIIACHSNTRMVEVWVLCARGAVWELCTLVEEKGGRVVVSVGHRVNISILRVAPSRQMGQVLSIAGEQLCCASRLLGFQQLL